MGFLTGFLRFCGFSVVRAWQGFAAHFQSLTR